MACHLLSKKISAEAGFRQAWRLRHAGLAESWPQHSLPALNEPGGQAGNQGCCQHCRARPSCGTPNADSTGCSSSHHRDRPAMVSNNLPPRQNHPWVRPHTNHASSPAPTHLHCRSSGTKAIGRKALHRHRLTAVFPDTGIGLFTIRIRIKVRLIRPYAVQLPDRKSVV